MRETPVLGSALLPQDKRNCGKRPYQEVLRYRGIWENAKNTRTEERRNTVENLVSGNSTVTYTAGRSGRNDFFSGGIPLFIML